MAWTIRPVVKNNVLVNIDLIECSCSDMKLGEPLYSSKEEAEDNFGTYWDSKWERFKEWKKVYKGYIDPVKSVLYLKKELEEKDKMLQQIKEELNRFKKHKEEKRENAFQKSYFERFGRLP